MDTYGHIHTHGYIWAQEPRVLFDKGAHKCKFVVHLLLEILPCFSLGSICHTQSVSGNEFGSIST